jgi:hypothetical protein
MSCNTKNLEEGVGTGSSPARQTGRRQPKASVVETATRSKKELPTQSLSCTQVLQTLGHALSAMRSEDCHRPILGNRTKALIHVPRMFKSHV